MTELTYEVPVVGEKHRASDPRVTTALTEIRTVLNGRMTAGNFASETLTPKKFKKPEAWKLVAKGIPELKSAESTTFAGPGASLSVLLTIILGALTTTVLVEVGGVQVGEVRNINAVVPFGPFRWPENEALTLKCLAGKVLGGDLSELKGGLL